MTHNQKKNQWAEIDTEVTKTLLLANNDLKIAIINMFMDLRESCEHNERNERLKNRKF